MSANLNYEVARMPWLQLAGIGVLVVLFTVTGIAFVVPAYETTEGMATVALITVYLGGFLGAGALWCRFVSRWQAHRDQKLKAQEQAHADGALSVDLYEHLYNAMCQQNGGSLSTLTFLWALKALIRQHSAPILEMAVRQNNLSALMDNTTDTTYWQGNGVQPHTATSP